MARSGILALACAAALAACSVVGIRDAPEPAFAVIGRLDAVELRRYAPRIAAETCVDGDEIAARSAGFRLLAGYIFGNNIPHAAIAMTAPVAQARETIAMTAPVGVTQGTDQRWCIRFFMPAQYTLETLPRPRDDAVRLVELPAETMAVLRFTGSTAPDAVALRQQTLLDRIGRSDWQPAGAIVAWFYDPPWTLPFLRRNEVAVPVAKRG